MDDTRKIVTDYFAPYWIAFREGYDLGCSVGTGTSEQAAIDELLEWETLDE